MQKAQGAERDRSAHGCVKMSVYFNNKPDVSEELRRHTRVLGDRVESYYCGVVDL